MKWLCRRLCGLHPVRVIHGSGQVLYLSPHTTVEEVLRFYPHHFLCQPGLSIYSGWRSNQMLAMDTELQSGCAYFLFPLPRLFPAAPNLSPQFCRCYQSQKISSSQATSRIFYDCPWRVVEADDDLQPPSWWCVSSCSKNSKSKVSPEANLYSGGGRCFVNLASTPLCLPWRPRLNCISEEDEVFLEYVKRYCRKLFKRGNQMPPSPPCSASIRPIQTQVLKIWRNNQNS